MKILIIEDENVLAGVLKEKFEKENFSVKVAINGEEAFSTTESFKPNLIVLDIMLPKVDGFTYLEKIKEDKNFKQIPVVVVSNLGDDDDIKRALQLGAVDYFVKADHSVDEIVEKIKSVLLKVK